MDKHWNQLIERYMQGELSEEGRLAFELEMESNADLRTEYEIHGLIYESIHRSAERAAILAIGKRYHFKAKLYKVIGFTSVIVAVIVSAYLILSHKEQPTVPTEQNDAPKTETQQPKAVTSDDATDSGPSQDLPLAITAIPGTSFVKAKQLNPKEIQPILEAINNEVKAEQKAPEASASNPPADKTEESKTENKQNNKRENARSLHFRNYLGQTTFSAGSLSDTVPRQKTLTVGNFSIHTENNLVFFRDIGTNNVIVLERPDNRRSRFKGRMMQNASGVEYNVVNYKKPPQTK